MYISFTIEKKMWGVHEVPFESKLIALFSSGWTENCIRLDKTGHTVHIWNEIAKLSILLAPKNSF